MDVTRPVRRLLSREEGPPAVRRAVWVTVAGCTGFYTLAYALDERVMALYAMFGALPLVLFAQLPGPARQRTPVFLVVLPVGCALVTAGTLLAVSDWAAACGMLVVGFAVSFLGIGAPRPAGPAAAFQLYYVLPCFPPYAPETLGDRLAGLTAGILLTTVADRLLWADPAPRPYRVRLADATAALAGYCGAVGRLLADGGPGPAVRELGEAADRALHATRLSQVPPTERPTAASLRDRALNHSRAAARHLRNQLDSLGRGPLGGCVPDPAAARLLEAAAEALRQAARTLRAGTPEPGGDTLSGAVRAFDTARAEHHGGVTPERLRQGAVVRSAAEGALLACEAARIACGAQPGPRWRDPGGPFAYALAGPLRRWWRRLRLHLTLRSVLLQNALRLAVALACARLVAGVLDLPHGFWVLLGTLSLMRTSAADTRGALVPAFVGTALGGAVATLLLMLVGDVPVFYAVATPVVILVGFSVGPVLGPAWTQAAMTLTFMVLFAQIAPPEWQLPAVRLVDVLVGGSLGMAASLLAWPRGGHGQLRCVVRDFLSLAAEGVKAVTAQLSDGRDLTGARLKPLRREQDLAGSCYLQYRTETASRHAADPSWEAVMLPGRHVVVGGELMLTRRHEGAGEPLPVEAAAELSTLADRVAAECLRTADTLRTPPPPAPDAPPHPYPASASGPLRLACHPQAHGMTVDDALLITDIEAWLTGVAHDAERARRATVRAARHPG
ncbi:FUSC family protein [Streptomyces sp. NPDC046215]|uniref:FUSC family protein n=1 Tax=Streptomyces sp. NPDC046215 TaxID=3155774 RepID=UPI0033E65B0D